jgi:hypothetical protein
MEPMVWPVAIPALPPKTSKKLVAATLKKRVILHLRAIRRNAPAQEGTVLQLNCCIFY